MAKYWGIVLFFISTAVFAQATSNADQFAAQAGAIAGAAQSCGQDITEYNSRINDAIDVLGTDASDKQQAMTLYDKAMADIQYTQTKLHNLNCAQVAQSFETLPIMQADYKTTVLPALAKMNTPDASSNSAAPAPTVSTDQTTPPEPPPISLNPNGQ